MSKSKKKKKDKKGLSSENGQDSGELQVVQDSSADVQNDVHADSDEDTISFSQLKHLLNRDDLPHLLDGAKGTYKKLLNTIQYEEELEKLQIELVKMQRWVQDEGKRIAIIFEGRDAAGKGGAIRRFIEHLSPRYFRTVALPKPTEEEKGQWYFQRYIRHLPNKGEIVFFDRSWYNRAIVEPVNGFCTPEQYQVFMQQVNEFEQMINADGVTIIKLWFSISKKEQIRRFTSRQKNPLKQWKLSPIDMHAQEKWDEYTRYKNLMFKKTSNAFSPWVIVQANNKQEARLECIRYVLSVLPYPGKNEKVLHSKIFKRVIRLYRMKESA
ncbi:MAG: polyphosphate kinase 2 [Sphingobacteriales bacterium]|nr:polyphosphate kinase 2 [Sphingobacteriales bacterium]